MIPLLDRDGLNYLVAMHTKSALAQTFGVTLPTLRKYINGGEPKNINVTRGLNATIARMMERHRKL